MAMLWKNCLLFEKNLIFLKNNPTATLFFKNISVHSQKRQISENLKSQEIPKNLKEIKNLNGEDVFSKINNQIVNKSHGRLFAVVQIYESQYKVTNDDIIVVKKDWAPTISDQIRLEKVLLVGSSDFTLIGRPLLPSDQVSVHATVIEKSLSHTIPVLFYKPRRRNTRCNFLKQELTFLRITSIKLTGKVNELGETDGFKDRIF